MTETVYARDLRVIWRPDPQWCYEVLSEHDSPWTVYHQSDSGGYWDATDPEGDWDARVSGMESADQVIHGIIGDPVDATDDQVQLLIVGAGREFGYVSAVEDHEVLAMDVLVACGLFVAADTGEGAWPGMFQITAAGVAKAAMLS